VIRIVLISLYLAAAAVAVILINADTANASTALALLGMASLLLGGGTGQPLLGLLAFLAVPFALPFGLADKHLGSDPPLVGWLVFFYGFGSAILIMLAALTRMVVDARRRERRQRRSTIGSWAL
jgi:hypothetical protein